MPGLLTTLFEAPDLPRGRTLPERLSTLHGGGLGFALPRVYANFVTSLDGITAHQAGSGGQGRLISGGVPADRFLMGLLRAFADAVLVGAGTLRAESDHRWTAERVFPAAGADYAELRTALGLRPQPRLVVVTGSGNVDPSLPALTGGMILAAPGAARRLAASAPAGVEVVELEGGRQASGHEIVARLRERGLLSILTEGGPHLFGRLLAEGLVDELFLTLSPVLAGRAGGGSVLGLAEGVDLLPAGRWGRLMSVRSGDSHLFLRYDLTGGGSDPANW